MTEQISEAQRDAIDKLYESPSEKAQRVFDFINTASEMLRADNKRHGVDPETGVPTHMDLLAFAIEFIGMKAQGIGDENLTALAASNIRWLYSIHYSNPDSLYGEEGRRE